MKKEKFPTRLSMVMYFLRGAIHYFVWAIIFACLVSLLDLLSPKIISYTVDTILDGQPSSLSPSLQRCMDWLGGAEYLRAHLSWLALFVIAVAALGAVCRYFFRVFNAKGAETLVKTMRDDLFSHILHLPFYWYSENHTGDIIQRCTSDVEQIKMFLSEQLVQLFRVILLICLAMYFMFGIHSKLALVSSLFIPIIVGYSFFFHHKIGASFSKVDIEEGKLSSIAQENLTGVRVVRAFGRESYERNRFETQNTSYTNMWVHMMRLMSAFWSSSDIFSGLQILSVLSFGAYLCFQGELSAGNYIAFISYNNMLMWPIRSLGRVIANMSKAGISIDRLRYIMNSEAETDKPDAGCPDFHQDIVFEHVRFQYENSTHDTLEDVSFKIPAGSTLGILGGTGSGKSTLMYLLDRLYDLPEGCGKITVGGVDIADMKASWVRQNIGMVLQEPYLFSRTLSENIKIASPKSDMREIQRVARMASLDDTIEHFSEGYETFVGERGVTLSGGQKQRAAIAQMLIRKPAVMVFDDSLSAVDAETDAKIRAALKENIDDVTTILIAHRITTLMNADYIIVMEEGKIVEEGTHEQLLAKQGVYRKIYDLQFQQSEIGTEAA